MENRHLREKILNDLTEVLEPLDFVHAMWQCGSAAFQRMDEWSDIDIVVDVQDDKLMDVFEYTDKVLTSISPVERSYECPQIMSPGAYQKAYKLQNTNEFLVIEICAVKHSSKNKFLDREIHSEILVHFDKNHVTDPQPINKKEFAKKLNDRIQQVEKLFKMYQFTVKKEYNRGNDMEALTFYQSFSLTPLIEMLRIKYSPYRYSFRTRYIHYDLPEDVVNRLHTFFFIKDIENLKVKHEEVISWFEEVVKELKTMNLEEKL